MKRVAVKQRLREVVIWGIYCLIVLLQSRLHRWQNYNTNVLNTGTNNNLSFNNQTAIMKIFKIKHN